jgi:hypothetical protein
MANVAISKVVVIFSTFSFSKCLSILKQVTSQVVRIYLSHLFSFVEGKGLIPFCLCFFAACKRGVELLFFF